MKVKSLLKRKGLIIYNVFINLTTREVVHYA